MLDALQAAELPVYRGASVQHFPPRAFRQHSYVSLAAKGVICGLGAKGYELALEAMAEMLAQRAWLRLRADGLQSGRTKRDSDA